MYRVKQPLRNEVLVRIVKAERVADGIILSDKTKERDTQGVVLATGPMCTSGLKRGDVVLLPDGRLFKLTIDGIEYKIINEDDILGTVEMEGV